MPHSAVPCAISKDMPPAALHAQAAQCRHATAPASGASAARCTSQWYVCWLSRGMPKGKSQALLKRLPQNTFVLLTGNKYSPAKTASAHLSINTSHIHGCFCNFASSSSMCVSSCPLCPQQLLRTCRSCVSSSTVSCVRLLRPSSGSSTMRPDSLSSARAVRCSRAAASCAPGQWKACRLSRTSRLSWLRDVYAAQLARQAVMLPCTQHAVCAVSCLQDHSML